MAPPAKPDFLTRSKEHQLALGAVGAAEIMAAGRKWDLGAVLSGGGSLIFPHATLTVCGHQIAAVVHACLDSGADTVLALGVLHALTPELQDARKRIAEGGNPGSEPSWGIQGPGAASGQEDWLDEFSLSHFQFLWDYEIRRRGIRQPPRLILRYPNLAAGHPELLPGFDEVDEIARSAVVVATMDPVHHGIGYGDPPETALAPESGGIKLAHQHISKGMALICDGSYEAYVDHCTSCRSDGRDVGQLLAKLRHPSHFRILDLIADDMTGPYNSPPPTWVAGALIALSKT